jgi:hypothetical protein
MVPGTTLGKEHLLGRWLETQAANGLVNTGSGSESFRDWKLRGPYFAHAWYRQPNSGAVTVSVKSKFSAAIPDTQLLLFSYSMERLALRYENERLVEIFKDE